MGELKNEQEQLGVNHTLPPKRKPDDQLVEHDDDVLSHSQSKKPKPEALLDTKLIEHNNEHQDTEQDDDDDDDDEEEDEYEEEDDEDEDEEEEHSNGEAEIDVKGKGIMKDDKGKGKLIEESEEEEGDSSDDDDDAINGSDDDSDSDLSDDPLAEVDLDNILPSRTRSRRGASRGVFIDNNDHKDNGDDDN